MIADDGYKELEQLAVM